MVPAGHRRVWATTRLEAYEDLNRATWPLYWGCQPCSYPERTGDLRSIIKISDFYSIPAVACQRHVQRYLPAAGPSSMSCSCALADPTERTTGPGRTIRLFFFRQSGPDFSERDRAVLTLLRPHLDQAYLDAARHRHPVPRLTPAAVRLAASRWRPGTPTPRSPAASGSLREPCAPTWRISTRDCTSRAVPPLSPAPSQTGSPRGSLADLHGVATGGTLDRAEDNYRQHWSAQRMSRDNGGTSGRRRADRLDPRRRHKGGGTPAVSKSVSKKATSAGLKGPDLARSEGLEPPTF